MSEQEFQEILEAVIAKTKVESFRRKSDPSHSDYIPRIRESILMIYRGETRKPAPAPPIYQVESIEAARTGETATRPVGNLAPAQLNAFNAEVSRCPHRTKDMNCNCQHHLCALGKGIDGKVNAWHCLRCLEYVDHASEPTEKGLNDPSELNAPSLLRRAKNAAKAAVGFVASGMEMASTEEASHRLAICHQPCELFRASDGICTHPGCGCFLAGPIGKTRIASQKCPLGKW